MLPEPDRRGAVVVCEDDAPTLELLSGRGTDADRVRGFGEGADDYVTKPKDCSLPRFGGSTTIPRHAVAARPGREPDSGGVGRLPLRRSRTGVP
jgi:hypothetical protein